MMSINADTVKHVANLARLNISDDEVESHTNQLSQILGLMDQLNSLPTDNVEPMTHAVDMLMPAREDVVVNGDSREILLNCAPDSEDGHFRVPKIIE
ncbi:MAG: Asp-tRNA(Asn)/Glu-tRNA(Gln) amidotransferase subunit GatC [Magnetococcales bacterium]|nr:Asp-tRNA(Asn)/Glu-tRNA(Gln) amidotransferase subunit GatC [Magnetococcales bacterium]